MIKFFRIFLKLWFPINQILIGGTNLELKGATILFSPVFLPSVKIKLFHGHVA